MKAKKVRPCGFKLTGNLKEHVAHYRTCPHPFCKGRLEAFEGMKKIVLEDIARQRKAGQGGLT